MVGCGGHSAAPFAGTWVRVAGPKPDPIDAPHLVIDSATVEYIHSDGTTFSESLRVVDAHEAIADAMGIDVKLYLAGDTLRLSDPASTYRRE